MIGEKSFFPHMTDEWKSLVNEKLESFDTSSDLVILHDEDACCIEGARKEVSIVVAEQVTG